VPVDRERLHRTLNPRSVVVVGDKGPNYQWLSNQADFTGELYSVQVDPKEVTEIEKRGHRNFASLADVPGDIDLVICAVPRPIAPRIVEAAVARGVGGVSMFTSGFAETGEPEAIALQERIIEVATAAGLPVVGPNCMGIYNRRLGLKFTTEAEHGEGGTVSVAAQSGTHAIGLTLGLQRLGMKVTRSISMGNSVVLNAADYVEYLRDDPDTEVIALYVEDPRDGRRFFEALKAAVRVKPVVVWRGGRSPAGARAIQSHTGSLASEVAVWDAMVKQAGAIGTRSIDETLDTVAAIAHTSAPAERGIALIAMTGGQSVAISDQFQGSGFDVPRLSDASYAKLAEFFTVIGGAYGNPFDAASTIGRESDNLAKILEILAEDGAIDGGVAIELSARGPGPGPGGQNGTRRLDTMLDLLDGYRQRTGQPVVAMISESSAAAAAGDAIFEARSHVASRGFAVFPNFERAAAALGRVVDFYSSRTDA
jgi:acyl-CoA synthetase (NDP forming)